MSMQITFRTLKGGTFKVDAEPSDTIISLKQKVAAQQGVEDYAGYRLIYKGKILADDATITSAEITPTGFVVVMPPKKAAPKPSKPAEPKASESAKESPATPSSSKMDVSTPEQPSATGEPSKPDSADKPGEEASPSSAPSAADPAPSDPSSTLVTGAAYESSVKQICEMGFPEDQVKKALRAAFNNPQRAVDYLFNGIPEIAEPPAPPAAAPTTTPPSTAPATAPTTQAGTQTTSPAAARSTPGTPFNMFQAPPSSNTPGTGGGQGQEGGPLDFLRRWPQFNAMRRLIQANPSVLPQLLAQLEEANPALLSLIDANQVEFTRLINEPLPEGAVGGDDEVMEQLAQAMAHAGGSGAGQLGPGQVVVTEEEHEQILRLSELGATIGLEESDVVETWLACNRDETSAANFLLDHAEELRADKQRNDANPNQQNNPESGGDSPPA